MSNNIILLTGGELAQTAALGVNLTDADIAAKIEAGPLGLLAKNSISIGGICTDYSGNIYISDPENHVILKIKEGGVISILAGQAGTSGINGALTKVPISSAKFNQPRGLACDKSGTIYVADTGNNQIRAIRDGFVSHIAGQGDGSSGFVGGYGGTAAFNGPYDVAVDSNGNLYVADTGNNSIRIIFSGGRVQIYAGSSSGDAENVPNTTAAIFNAPKSVAVDASGIVYVCDSGNYKIKVITPTRYTYLHSGSGVAGKDLGTTAFNCKYNDLMFSDVDRSENLYVVDQNTVLGSRVLKINREGIPSVVNDFNGSAVNNSVIGLALNKSQKLFVVTYGDPDVYASSSSSSSTSDSSESSSSSRDSSSSTSDSSESSSSTSDSSESSSSSSL